LRLSTSLVRRSPRNNNCATSVDKYVPLNPFRSHPCFSVDTLGYFFSLHKLVVRVVSTILGLVGTSLHGTERSQHSVLVVFLVGCGNTIHSSIRNSACPGILSLAQWGGSRIDPTFVSNDARRPCPSVDAGFRFRVDGIP
jgi:hypothetical protein